jgi:hypothetical protein
MQDNSQFRVRIHITNRLMCRFANRQLWPLAVLMLRIPRVMTTGHPFQGYSGIPCANIGFFECGYPARYPRFCTQGYRNAHV